MVKPREIIESINIEDKQNTKWRLKLDENENIYGCANSILSAIKNVQSSDVFQYPKYENLLEKFEIKYHQNKNRILFANGRQEAMQSLIKAYLNNGEEILAPKSSDELFDFSPLNDEYKIKYFDFDSDLNINVAYIKQKISLKTKIIYISTPDEVVGKIIRPSMLRLLSIILFHLETECIILVCILVICIIICFSRARAISMSTLRFR